MAFWCPRKGLCGSLLGVKDLSFHAIDTANFRGVLGISTVEFIKEASVGGYHGIWQRRPRTLCLNWNYGSWLHTVPDNLQWGSAQDRLIRGYYICNKQAKALKPNMITGPHIYKWNKFNSQKQWKIEVQIAGNKI